MGRDDASSDRQHPPDGGGVDPLRLVRQPTPLPSWEPASSPEPYVALRVASASAACEAPITTKAPGRRGSTYRRVSGPPRGRSSPPLADTAGRSVE
jgi:hypothetical protein